MRERYLEAFDAIRIDCLNGDKYKTGKTTPDGDPDPSIFSTPEDPVGIQVGTAITTLVRKADHAPTGKIGFRHLWGQAKREDLTARMETEPDALYDSFEPSLTLGLPFARMAVSDGWHDWPSLPELLPVSFQGAETGRDSFLIDTDLGRLRGRISEYFDEELTHEEIARIHPRVMRDTGRFDARTVRDTLLKRGGPSDGGFVRHAYRPFDNRWLYWEVDTKLLREKSPRYPQHVFEGNLWLSAAQHLRRGAEEPQTCVVRHLASRHLIERGTNMFPAWLHGDGIGTDMDGGMQHRPNLSPAAQLYLDGLGLGVEDLFHHALAVLHDPAYRKANAGALRMEWPRIPLPGWPDGDEDGAADDLVASAARGREFAALLDSDTPVPGVTEGTLRPEIATVAVPSTTGGGNMTGEDFALTVGWGHFGQGEAVMPGQGRVVERPYTAAERAALGRAAPTLGETTSDPTNRDTTATPPTTPAPPVSTSQIDTATGKTAAVLGDTTFDIYLNHRAYWRNVPAAVWNYKLGGYQVLKKWLSYRESAILGRPLKPEEVQHFTNTARRITAILVLTTDSV